MRNLVLLTLVAICCCTSDKKKAGDQNTPYTETEFVEYLNLLPSVTLPFETNCEKCCRHLEIDYDNKLINKFKPDGAAIFGLVNKTDDRAIILVTYPADMIIPSLKVYDLRGNLVGDMTFMGDYCGGEPGFYSRQFFRIDRDFSIHQIDTLYEMTYDSVTYQTIDTVDVKITAKKFVINAKGNIVEENTRQQ